MAIKLHDASTEPHNAGATQKVLWFHCPGCECDHGVRPKFGDEIIQRLRKHFGLEGD